MARLLLVTPLLVLGLAAPVRGEVVEEETWYNAEGEVVKKVKRTFTGREAREQADWEPAWVERERRRDRKLAGGRRFDSDYGGWRSYVGPVFVSGGFGRHLCFWPVRHRVCYPRAVARRAYRGGCRWAVRVRTPGLTIRYCR